MRQHRLHPVGLGPRTRIITPILFFFFSSRRRHTRFDCDWSSDVCSSDLTPACTAALTDLSSASSAEPPRLMFADRKSTRLNSSHSQISYAVFCLKKKKNSPRCIYRRSLLASICPHTTLHADRSTLLEQL